MNSCWVRTKSDEAAVDAGCTFDIRRADRVRKFCYRFLRHSKGQWAGKPVEFFDWQWQNVIAPAFAWMMPDGFRRFRRVGCGVPKKNGKSTMLAALSCYLLIADGEPGAEIYSAAADRDQASIIYNEAANMVDASPELKAVLKVRRSTKRIEYPDGRSIYKALSADVPTKEGLNVHALLFDELHAQPNDDLWNVLRYGGAARRQPMFWWISTAGEEDDTLLWHREWSYARAIQESRVVDISYLPCIYEITRDDDWTKEESWRKANPSYDYTLNKREFAEECERAKQSEADRIPFLRYRLNLPTKAESKWLGREYWDACGEDYTLRDIRHLPCVAGFDLAETTDMVAFVNVFRDEDQYFLWPMFWVCERSVQERERKNKTRFDGWVKSGHLTMTRGEPIVDAKIVRRDIVRTCRRGCPSQVVIDRWHATQLAYSLRRDFKRRGLPGKFNFIRFGFQSASPAWKELTALILTKRIKHPRNPVLDWMFGNVVVQHDPNGNQKPDRAASADKIDGFAAITMALAAMMQEDKERTKYEDKGLSSV